MKKFLSVLLLILIPTLVSGLTFNSNLTDLEPYKKVRLKLNDKVNGGCWTNLKEVREYTEEKIKNSGMTLTDDGTHKYSLIIDVIGGRPNEMCSGSVTVGLYSTISLKTNIRGLLTIKERGGFFVDSSLNRNILDVIGLFFKK
jgi:hypothetical protein